jgi:cytochrome c biogenesis protein CcmG, thiol:disulfide interchange protein DsbE
MLIFEIMKKIACVLFLSFSAHMINAQNKSLPNVSVQTLDGAKVNLAELKNDGKPIYISFWALWCVNCIKELNTITDMYADWQKETGVKIVALSIDDERNKQKVKPFVNGKAWEYDILLDPNSDVKRALNINQIPYSMIIDGNGNIVWEHIGYAPGDENEVYEQLKKLSAK